MQHYDSLTNSKIEEIITEQIHSERDRRIIRMKLIDGLSYEKIAELMDMSPRQIQNIERKYRPLFFEERKTYTEICFS
jgi:DNA-directed RNA polymerase specialized sigma24 family protein